MVSGQANVDENTFSTRIYLHVRVHVVGRLCRAKRQAEQCRETYITKQRAAVQNKRCAIDSVILQTPFLLL